MSFCSSCVDDKLKRAGRGTCGAGEARCTSRRPQIEFDIRGNPRGKSHTEGQLPAQDSQATPFHTISREGDGRRHLFSACERASNQPCLPYSFRFALRKCPHGGGIRISRTTASRQAQAARQNKIGQRGGSSSSSATATSTIGKQITAADARNGQSTRGDPNRSSFSSAIPASAQHLNSSSQQQGRLR